MIQLDRLLIDQARRLITGANIHPMKTRIFLYEQAVALHNSGHPRHARYHRHYEDLLREYVVSTGLANSLGEQTKTGK